MFVSNGFLIFPQIFVSTFVNRCLSDNMCTHVLRCLL